MLRRAIARFKAPRAAVCRFVCNICGQANSVEPRALGRETPSCAGCGSSVRFRAIVDVLTQELFGRSIALPDCEAHPELVGIGLSDWEGYAQPLAERLAYTNTFLHREPVLDIADPPSRLRASCDFIIASDVLEHVAPPVARAFTGLRALLKPGGLALVTVPYVPHGDTVEHFPDLAKWQVRPATGGGYVLENTTVDGRVQTFDKLVFHGGEGSTLEMRVFSETGLTSALQSAGFRDVAVHGADRPEHGIVWTDRWSLPFTARAPA